MLHDVVVVEVVVIRRRRRLLEIEEHGVYKAIHSSCTPPPGNHLEWAPWRNADRVLIHTSHLQDGKAY